MIKLENVSCGYEGKLVIDGLTATLPETGVVAVTGASGKGKSTFLRLLAGLIKPVSGRVTGMPARVSYVFQEDRLLPWLTALENVAVVNDSGNAARWLNEMELSGDAHTYPKELSGGMQRRVAIARAMNYGGGLLLLDEPFKGLDAELRSRVASRIKDVFPLTVIATHDIEEAALLGVVSRIDL